MILVPVIDSRIRSDALRVLYRQNKIVAFRCRKRFRIHMNTKPDLSSYAYLWTTEFPNWVLVDLGKHPNGRLRRLIVNRNGAALIIEDNAVSTAVKEAMLEHGCELVGPDFLKK